MVALALKSVTTPSLDSAANRLVKALIYNETNAPLGDAFEGDTVVLAVNTGGRQDANWRRNYLKAKELADQGKVQRIVAKISGDHPLRTVHAFRQAVGAGHPALQACVDNPDLADAISAVAPLACAERCAQKVETFVSPRRKKEPAPEDTAALDMKAVLAALNE